ncbi:MAG: ASPIC/UnbV domain-containing protein, partial [Myxococcota bacterium]|nr:ASPIC/UnbV domain-containing protein [Myxococcota bacterium]
DAPLLLLHQRVGVFVDRAQELGLTAMGSFRSVVALDMNDDGVEDFLFSQAADRPLLFLSESCTAAHWIEVDAPVGARVEVTAGGRTQTDWVTLDSGYIATTLPRVHLGLGQTDVVDLIRVFLPGGEMLQAVGPIDARQRVIFPG